MFLVALAAAVTVNFAFAVVLHHKGLQTGLWDLHFWAIFPGTHTPGWMPVNDSWMPMRKAYAWFAHPHQGTLYQQVFFSQHVKFQYPPSSLLLFAIPGTLHLPVSDRLLNWIGWLSVLGEAAATGALAFTAAPALDRRWRLALAIATGAVVMTFHSVLWAFSLGQVQTWLNAWFAFAALAYLTGRRRTAGVLIGLMCLFKPQFALFVLWAALRRQWGFLTGLGIVLAAGVGLSVLWFGIANHVDYLSAISFMNRHGEVYYPNAAVNGVMNRLIGNGDPFTVDKNAFPPFNTAVYYIATFTSLGLIAIALFFRRRTTSTADFLCAAVIFTIASPIAWVHHLGILPPAFAFLAMALVSAKRKVPIDAGFLAFAYLASAIFIPPLKACASGAPSLVYAIALAGALTAIILLLRVGRTPSIGAADQPYQARALFS